MNTSINFNDRIKSVYDALHLGKVDLALKTIQELDKMKDLTPKQLLKRNIATVRVLIEIGETDDALKNIKEVINSPDINEDILLLANAKAAYATGTLKFGELGKAKTVSEEVEKIIKKMNDMQKEQAEEILAEINNLNGLIYNNQGELPAALEQYKNSMVICKKLNLRKELGMLNFNIASVYKLQKNFSSSLTHFEDPVKIFIEIEYHEAEAKTLLNIEEIHKLKGDNDLSFVYKQKRENLTDKIHFKKSQLEATINKNKLERELERLNAENIELKQQIWSYKFEIDATANSTDKTRTLPGTLLQTTSEELEKTRKELEINKKMYDEVHSELSNVKSGKRDYEKKLQIDLEQQKQQTNNKIQSLKSDLKDRETKLNELKIISENDKAEFDHLKSSLNLKGKTLEDTEKELIKAQDQLKKITKDKSLLEDKINKFKENNKKLEDEVKKVNENLDKLKRDSSDITRLRGEYEKEIAEYKEKLISDSEFSSITDKKIKELEEERSQLKSELQLYKSKFAESQKDLDKLKFEVEKPIKQTRLPLEPKPIEKKPSISPLASRSPIITRGLPGTIEDLFNKDRLAKKIANALEQRPRIQLRMLSMQLGSSPAKILDTVKQLEAKGYLVLNFSYREDPNPEISLSR